MGAFEVYCTLKFWINVPLCTFINIWAIFPPTRPLFCLNGRPPRGRKVGIPTRILPHVWEHIKQSYFPGPSQSSHRGYRKLNPTPGSSYLGNKDFDYLRNIPDYRDLVRRAPGKFCILHNVLVTVNSNRLSKSNCLAAIKFWDFIQ